MSAPILHRWLDTWTGLGLVVVGVERQGLRLSLSHIGEDEWRAYFMASPMFAPAGFGVAPTPWQAVQIAARTALRGQEPTYGSLPSGPRKRGH